MTKTGDTFNVAQGVGVGRNVSMNNVTVNQNQGQPTPLNLPVLTNELAMLRAEMKKQASEPEHDIAVGSVAAAEKEANGGDESRTLQFLSAAGNWALDVAVKIGTPVAVEALRKALGA